MDSQETKNTLPLPVKEIVRHMRKSLGSTTARNRRLSDVCPLTSRQENDPSHSPKPALTPGIHNSTRTFSPSSLVSCSTLSKLTNSTNMDVIVPRGNCTVHIAASSPVSFHDQERSAVVRFCGNSQFASTAVNSASDTSGLDDRIEGSSLMTFRTPNLFNSAQQTADSTSAKFSAAAKLERDNCMPSKHSTRIELHTEPAISPSNVLGPHESDNQHHFPICHGVSDFSKQTAISSTISATGSAAGSSQTMRHVDTVVPSLHVSQKQPALTTNQCENSASLRIHFPQRLCRPQIGVAAVIKSTAFSREANDGPETIQFQSPELYKLVSITSPQTQPGDISSTRVCSDRKHVAKQISTSGNQVVPSSDATTLMPSSNATLRTNVSISHLGTVSSETLAMEESTDDKWKDVKNFMHSPEYEPSTKRRKRIDSGSSEQMSDDDDDDVSSSYGDKDDDSHDDYSDIDADLADIKPSECESLVALGKKQKQYFWQYNVQSKGPKGTRLKLAVESPRDPHVLNDFEDPVFDECNTAIAGIRHGGKARKGDGNEITPNPRKLFMIGHQLMRLNHQINACQLGTDVPVTKRTESRKEKNKLASRACRLKKKAQHEANKVKLYGLEQEHSQLNSVLQFIWPQIYKKAKSIIANTDRLPSLSSTSTSLTSLLEAQINQNLKSMVAGHTVEYVNSVILNVESGDYSGGLNIRRSHKTRISSLV